MAHRVASPFPAMARTALADRRTSARIVLVLGLLSGISYSATTAVMSPEQFGLASEVYATAAEGWLRGEDPYAVSPEHLPAYRFLYPPIVLLVFVPHALVGPAGAYAIQTALNLVSAGAIALVIWRALDRSGVDLPALDRGLILAFVLFSPYGVPQLIQGQTTLWLALAFALGFDLLDRDRGGLGGLAFAGAAIVKVFPAAIGLWLVRLRAWPALAGALAAGLGAIALGALMLGPELTVQYFTDVLFGRYEGQGYRRLANPHSTVGGVQRHLVGALDLRGAWRALAAGAVLAPVLALAYRRVDSDGGRQTAAVATVLAVLLFLPLQPLYFPLLYYPLLVLLYRLEAGSARTLLLVGVLGTFVMVDLDPVLLVLDVVPGRLAEPLAAFAFAFYRVALPTDVGMWLMLIACVVHQRTLATG